MTPDDFEDLTNELNTVTDHSRTLRRGLEALAKQLLVRELSEILPTIQAMFSAVQRLDSRELQILARMQTEPVEPPDQDCLLENGRLIEVTYTRLEGEPQRVRVRDEPGVWGTMRSAPLPPAAKPSWWARLWVWITGTAP